MRYALRRSLQLAPLALLAACAYGKTSVGTGASESSSSSSSGSFSSSSTSGSSSSSSASSSSSSSSGSGSTTGQWVLGYYVGYDIDAYPIAQIDWSGFTHVAFAPMVVTSGTTLDTSFDDTHGASAGPTDAKALSAAAHAHGVKALIMLGGAGAGANIATAASPANLSAFVTSLLGVMDSLGYDGIDLDWEDSVNLDDLVSLAQALRAARPAIVLTYPARPINANYETVDPRMAKLAASLDRFNVQTYSPATAFAGQGWDSWFSSPISGESASTPVAIDDTLRRYAAAGIPKAKLGMGMSFYAICYTGGITGPRQPTNGTTQTIVGGDNDYPFSAFFAAGSTFANSTAAEQKRDATAHVPYLTFANAVNDSKCGAATQYITYEDETSILAKGAFSKASGYGGIIVWTIEEGWLPANATEGRAQNALMQALAQGFLTP